MNKLVLLLLAILLACVSAKTNECKAVVCPSGTKCVEEPKQCKTLPCPQYACKAINKNPCTAHSCAAGEICLPEPKQCIRAPCPQFSCMTPEEYICATADCAEGTVCKAEPKFCKKSPCPQYTCEVDNCYGNTCNPETEICLSSPRMCIRAPCPQYTCKNLSFCALKCSNEYIPVCGSDGNTYTNACILQSTSCNTRTLITMIHEGECGNPVEPTADPCDRMCPMVYQPVCGTDGQTYGNQCLLGVASCRDDSIAFAYEGECEKNCDNKRCPMVYQPVCGTNGVTYSNDCLLSIAACKDDSIAVAYEGECKSDCEDKICPMVYQPVCGSNGITYGNQCMLNGAACLDKSITMAHEGPCVVVDHCAGNTCTATQICLADPKQCITTPCPQYQCIEASQCGGMCPMIYKPVCGTDGVTYSNTCMLRNSACNQNKVINVAHIGACEASA